MAKVTHSIVLLLAVLLEFGFAAPTIKFEPEGNQNMQLEQLSELMEKLGIKLEKPRIQWRIPNKLLMHPTACEKLNYCNLESAPVPGKFKRHPFFPWWYYSCEKNIVKCHSCHKNTENNDITYFYSERHQKCIS